MKLARFSKDGEIALGLVTAAGIVDLTRRLPGNPTSMVGLIAGWTQTRDAVAKLEGAPADHATSSVRLLAPVERPPKIFAIGLNYADHCAESNLEIPTKQTWFSKAATAINGPFDPIELPAVSEQLDYECEMVAVIGKRCRNVPRAQAKDVVFGYCVGDDVSVRDWQLATGQWVIGKSFDTHAPIGPWITTADSVDPHTLDIRTLVNGEVRQKSNTRELVFDVYAQVEQLTKAVTLEPGDLIFTGTCGGVAIARKPLVWLKAGDKVRVEMSELGAIENTVVPGPSEPRIG